MNSILVILLVITAACAPKQQKSFQVTASNDENITILASGLHSHQIAKAKELGLEVEGTTLVSIKGQASKINELGFVDNGQVIEDVAVEAISTTKSDISEEVYYLAKESFDLPNFLKKYPNFDGRKTIVGAIDDGVSPRLIGLQKTTTGERKYLNKTSVSDLYTFKVVKKEEVTNEVEKSYLNSYKKEHDVAYSTTMDEEQSFFKDSEKHFLDYNQNEIKNEKIPLAVFKKGDMVEICVDINVDSSVSGNECVSPFSATGEFTYWNNKAVRELTAEYDSQDQSVTLSMGEIAGDSHGEGVASVMSGHMIGGKFDGVAPGSQYIDYDLNAPRKSHDTTASYTLGTFVKALEWMGENGADVVNISYSLFFHSAKSQEFMQKALETLVKKYNFVICFSAGNNGPGLGSLNRGLIYPADVLAVGAYLDPKLDEFVHGVTGLPEQGKIVSYSSRGPGVHHGAGPVVISPLSSLTHDSGTNGYRAFSGTSSAAPAMAGLASILISAVRQSDLPVDAGAIVHSLRQSGKKLSRTPFVFQGGGLPQIGKAFEIYRKMIAGKVFKNITVNTKSTSAPDGVQARGALFRTSQENETKELLFNIQGLIPEKVANDLGADLLKTIDIEYSHRFLSGPSKLWVSTSSGRFYVMADLELASEYKSSEIFGEIRLIDSETKELLQTIPVTVLNDHTLDEEVTFGGSLKAQSGERIHLNIPRSVHAIGVEVMNGSTIEDRASLFLYNNAKVRTNRYSGLAVGKTFIFDTSKGGHFQLALARWGGTEMKRNFNLRVFPIELELLSNEISKIGSPSIYIKNFQDQVDMKVSLKEVFKPIATKFHTFSKEGFFEVSANVLEKGTYQLSTERLGEADADYLRLSCSHSYTDKDGKTQKIYGSSLSLDKQVKYPTIVKFKCFPFDFDGKKLSSGLAIIGKVRKSPKVHAETVSRLKSGTNKVSLKITGDNKINFNNRKFQVEVSPVFESNTGSVTIGNVEAF